MLIISCIMFINQFCYSLIHLIFFISKLTPAVQFLVDPCVEVRRFFIDFICLSPSWFLIIMIKSVRKRILPGMTERKKGKITTVVSTKTSTIVTVNSAKSY
uniref:Uncharacterized protein n=1 Tax=Acrobeloides nanus TaxID=290746 RepID=A0A914BW34_9BILA